MNQRVKITSSNFTCFIFLSIHSIQQNYVSTYCKFFLCVNLFDISFQRKRSQDRRKHLYPVDNCMFKANDKNTRISCEICSNLTIKTPEGPQWCRSGVFIVNIEHISHLVLVFLLLILSR